MPVAAHRKDTPAVHALQQMEAAHTPVFDWHDILLDMAGILADSPDRVWVQAAAVLLAAVADTTAVQCYKSCGAGKDYPRKSR